MAAQSGSPGESDTFSVLRSLIVILDARDGDFVYFVWWQDGCQVLFVLLSSRLVFFSGLVA